MARIFFGSAIDGVNFETIRRRYADVKNKLEAKGHILLNTASVYEDVQIETKGEDIKTAAAAIVNQDLEILKDADVLFVDVSNVDRQYIGSICEMVYAKKFGIRVVALLDTNSSMEKRPFFIFHCSEITYTWEEALSAIERVLSSDYS